MAQAQRGGSGPAGEEAGGTAAETAPEAATEAGDTAATEAGDTAATEAGDTAATGAGASAGAVTGPAGEADADGVIDLLGLLAYAELDAFFRLSGDAALAPSLADKAALGGMAVAEFSHFERIRAELDRLGADPDAAMQPFTGAVEAFHVRTAPSDWLESLVKAYVGDGFAADFYRALAEVLDPGLRALVLEVLADTGHAQFAVDHVRAAIEADPKVAGRLALWARRLVGEALGQAQRVAAQRPPLARLLVREISTGDASARDAGAGDAGAGDAGAGDADAGDAGDGDAGAEPASQLGDVGRMFARLTDAHAQRMSALGLSA